MANLLLTFAALACSVAAHSCLTLNETVVGGVSLGYQFSDYLFLESQESPDYMMRTKGIELCQNATGHLVGMRAIMHKLNYTNGAEISADAMNRIGSVPGGSACQPMIFGDTEYLEILGLRYSASQIEVVRLQSNLG